MEGRFAHTPVLLGEVIELLSPDGRQTIIDCTIGLGGHAGALLEAAPPQAQLIGIDVDESNLRRAKENLAQFEGRFRLFQANFSELTSVMSAAGVESADCILADLGIASSQLDDSARGLSFATDGPLDMRLDDRLARTAGDIVNKTDEKELADLIYAYGEERYSRRIAKAIVAQRAIKPITTTGELEEICYRSYPAATRRSRRGVHPATRTFQAIRIAVNDEMGCLDKLLASLGKVLSPGGRAAVISFHSLEDRRVKHVFADMESSGVATRLTKKPITATDEEIETNPRSRSAKLRGIEMIVNG